MLFLIAVLFIGRIFWQRIDLGVFEWYMTVDALRSLHWIVPVFGTSLATLVVVTVTRVATNWEWKYNHIRHHMPEIIRVQMGDLEAEKKVAREEADFWKARAEETNSLMATVDTRLAQLKQITAAIQSEDEIRTRRRKTS